VLFLYPDAINWTQGEGKDSPVADDVPGQAGFDAGDNVRYYTLPGSGMPQVTQLARSARRRSHSHKLYMLLAGGRLKSSYSTYSHSIPYLQHYVYSGIT